MDSTLAMALAGWLGTYLLHSTVLLGMIFLVLRWWRAPGESAEILWRVALFGGFLTASVQQHLDLVLWSVPTGAAWSPAALPDPPLAPAPVVPTPTVSPTVSPPAVAATRPEAAWDAGAYLQLLLGGWAVGVVALWALHAVRRVRLRAMLADRVALPPGRLLRRFRELACRAGLPPGTRLTTSRRIRCPMAFGILRPEVCLPATLAADMDFDQQSCVLAHELFHLRGRDPLWLLLQAGAAAVGFLQPLNRLAVRQLRELAEFRCDAWAVRHGGSRLHMANALMTVAESYLAAAQPVPAYAGVNAMAVRGSALSRRVDRILATPRASGKVGRGALLASVVLGLAAVAVAAPGVGVTATARGGSPGAFGSRIDSRIEPAIPADPRLRRLGRLARQLGNLQSDLDEVRERLEGSRDHPDMLALLAELEHRLHQLQTEQRALRREVLLTVRSRHSRQHFNQARR